MMVVTSSYCVGFILSIAIFYKVGILFGNYIAILTPMFEMKGSEFCMGDSCIAAPFSATTTAATITNLFEGANYREAATAYYNKVLGSLLSTTPATAAMTITTALLLLRLLLLLRVYYY